MSCTKRVWRERGSHPEIVLHGKAKEEAESLGINRFHLVLTHTATLAEAVVVMKGETEGCEERIEEELLICLLFWRRLLSNG